VIAEAEDIFGNGVNVAARLEALAEPGGIRVSRVARDQVRDRLDQRSSKAVSHSTGDQRFDSRLLQEETVKRTSNYVDLTRRAGTLLLLARSDSRPGGQGATKRSPASHRRSRSR
jgi:class 3 adenylate cyclase